LVLVDRPIAVREASRLAAIDVLRAVAIVAMVIYHTAFDLSVDGLIAVDVSTQPVWVVFARSIAGTFLFLVGVSLVLATRGGIRWPAYLRRLGSIVAGAALVTVATWWFEPATFVFFGILHEIALASVLALPFLVAPIGIVVVAAAAVIAAPWFLANPFFDQPALWWLGLSHDPPPTVDYVPILPWFGIVLCGVAAARLLAPVIPRLAAWGAEGPVTRLLAVMGRWGLAIYLVHQPLIVGALYLLMTFFPPGQAFLRDRFVGQCTPACEQSGRDGSLCPIQCACIFDGSYGTDLYPLRHTADMTPPQLTRWNDLMSRCTGG
jgi:uncharacterized membrane protein